MNPYQQFVEQWAELRRQALELPLGGITPAKQPVSPAPDAPCVLIFSPHPDDECIIGGFPLRLMRESGMRVVNVAVTQGSNKARQAERLAELESACRFLGFELVTTQAGGLENINLQNRNEAATEWRGKVERIADIILSQRPALIAFPHERDWNSTHIGTHWLVRDALGVLGASFACLVLETEFWGQMDDPNLMVELSAADVADLVAATSFHVGEVRRNPYHVVLPAWLMDCVRRGGELVGGQGKGPPNYAFATLYRLRRWTGNVLERFFDGGRQVSAGDKPDTLLTNQ